MSKIIKGGFVMVELQGNTKKGSLKKLLAMFLAFCVCVSTFYVNDTFAQAAEGTKLLAEVKIAEGDQSLEEGASTRLSATVSYKVATDETATPDVTATCDVAIATDGNATVSDENAQKVTWNSSDETVATVAADGTVTALKEGKTEITAISVFAKKKSAPVTITVTKKQVAQVAATGVSLNKTTLGLKVGGSETLTATVAPSNATTKTVTWTTSDAKVATVLNGKVTAVAVGKANITATTNNGKTATCAVTVTAADTTPPTPTTVAVTSVKLNKKSVGVAVGKTTKLTATVAPANATNKAVTWKSSNTKVATVKNGTVKGVKAGTATITVTTKDGSKKATCKVTVNPVTKVTTNTKEVWVKVKKTVNVQAYVTPSDSPQKKVTWTSKNKKIATVDKNGKIKGVKKGKTDIIAKAGSKSAKITVNVVTKDKNATSVKLNKKKANLNVKKTLRLTATMSKGATNTLKWTTSNKKVATVDKFGVVTAKKGGVAKITVQAGKKKATCTITVPGVTLKKTSASIKKGKTTTIQIKSTIVKNDKVKSYTSSNKKIATVDKKGKVKGIKKGKANITVTMKSGATAVFKVTVK